MNTLETRLRESLHDPALDNRAPTADEVLEGLRTAIHDAEPPVRRRSRTGVLPVVCAAAITLAIVAGGLLLVPRLTNDPPPTSSTSAPPSAPDGMRLVGINGIAVAVPETWGTNEVSCETPMADTVVFEHDENLGYCAAPERPAGVSSVRLVSSFSSVGVRYGKGAEPAGSVDGVPIKRVPTTVDRDGLATGAVVVPSENAVVFVDSPDPEVVDDVLATVSVVPDGYAPLPAPRFFEPLSRFSNRLHAAGFEVRTVTDEGPRMISPGDVRGVEPEAGTVLPVGSEVTVTVAGAP